jgi:zinc-ribbon family
MVYIGTMNWASTRLTGSFYCPTCQIQTEYRHRVSRPFLTLYFIPIIPIGGQTEFAQCKKCKNKFELLVVQSSAPPPPREVKRFDESLVEAMATVIWDDKRINASEMKSACIAFEKICGRSLDPKAVYAACQSVAQNSTNSTLLVVEQHADWSPEQQVGVLQALFFVASSNGEISVRRNKTLLACAHVFNMPQEQIQAAIEATLNWADSRSRS